jgi:hypothetical protein
VTLSPSTSRGEAGREVAYAEFTTLVQTAGGAETAVVSSPAFVFDGVTEYVIEFYCPLFANFAAATTAVLRLREDPAGANTDLGDLAQIASANLQCPVHAERVLTPSAGSHIYRVTIRRTAGAAEPAVEGGAGGAGAKMPGLIRITENLA